MATIQNLAALQDVLLKARIQFTTGTAAEWEAHNPVLNRGEVGLVNDTTPAQFKIGNGTTPWNSLTWSHTTALAQLSDDAAHRVVTDAQIGRWDAKAELFVFSHSAYLHPPTGEPAPAAAQVQIAKDIVAAVTAGKKTVIVVEQAQEAGMPLVNAVSGVVTLSRIGDHEITGRVGGMAVRGDAPENGVRNLCFADITFKADGTVTVKTTSVAGDLLTPQAIVDNLTDTSTTKALSANMGKALKAAIDNKPIPEYSLAKASTEAGFASTYRLTRDGSAAGVPINIPLDQVLRSSSIKTVTTAGSPYAGAAAGDKYVEFLFQNNDTPQYLPVQDLVDVYTTDGVYVQVSASNVISLRYDALKGQLQADLGGVFEPKGAAQEAVTAFQNKNFVIQSVIPGLN